MSPRDSLSTGTRAFVAIVYTVLGLSFILSTVTLFYDFGYEEGLIHATFDSHTFLFFPLFGVLALIAFYTPSVVFTHLYWHRMRFGKLRFTVGTLVVAGLAIASANELRKVNARDAWEIAPHVLQADKGDPAGCAERGTGACTRGPVMTVLKDLRAESQKRVDLSKFSRNCRPDERLELPQSHKEPRWCFPARAMLSWQACCTAQSAFRDQLISLYAVPRNHSLTREVHTLLLPLKTFFIIITIVIGIFLVIWRSMLDLYYDDYGPRIERGVLIGAFAMLFWPVTNYAAQLAQFTLYGRWQENLPINITTPSLLVAPWALLLLFYFLRRLGQRAETIGRVGGIAASVVAILTFDDLVNWGARIAGIGTDWATLGILVAIVLLALFVVLYPWKHVSLKDAKAEALRKQGLA